MKERKVKLMRNTKETKINLSLNVDSFKKSTISTTLSFFDHMLLLFTYNAMFELKLTAEGDDDHHLVEDIGIVLGDAIDKVLSDRKGITRYGFSCIPMDEALVETAIDVSGRPLLIYKVNFSTPVYSKEKKFDFCLIEEFFRAFASHAKLTLHINLIYGKNNHHVAEAIFKSFGRALSAAIAYNPKLSGIPSTKGAL
jgi:imidazoleglycerol-phosphate dehydratase